jgi:hypothetical protein
VVPASTLALTHLGCPLPGAANAVIKLGDGHGQYEVDYDYCKGCGDLRVRVPLRSHRDAA